MAARTRPAAALFMITSLLFLLLCNCRPIADDYDTTGLRGFDMIYQFGDSISDTGNLMRETNSSYCSYFPYGETTFGKPTGRCSNGLLLVDYFARAFNVPFLNPYLEKGANFSFGVNFAVAGATALDASRYPGVAPTNSSLPVQLGWFRNTRPACSSSSSECKRNLERALFLVGEVGGNDYNYALLSGQSIKVAQGLAPEVIQTIVDAVKEVIKYGARIVVVPGNFPIGCMPIYLNNNNFKSNDANMYDNLGCLISLNKLAEYHNQRLQEAIKKLQKQHPDVEIYYGDYYSGFTYILRNAESLGFEKDEVLKPCCGSPSKPCGSGEGVEVCPDPAKRISWDGIHLTQEAYRNLADWLLSNTFRHHRH